MVVSVSDRSARRRPRGRWLALVGVLALLLSACTNQIEGSGRLAQVKQGGDSSFPINGAVGSDYDKLAAKAMVDIESFWTEEFPQISGGEKFQPLQGGTWSVDGSDPSAASRKEACLAQDPTVVKDNLMHCRLDDSVVYDRTSSFFIDLAQQTGDFTLAAIFAHEMGHAIQLRLGTEPDSTVLVETQADCFAGAWIGWVLDGHAKNFRISADELDTTMIGYIQLRDPTGGSADDPSAHGNGFDRIASVADGIKNGASYCTDNWDQHPITERPYTTQADYDAGGDLPYSGASDGGDVVDLGPQDLEAFWGATFPTAGKTWKPVTATEVSAPKCSGTKISGEIGFCPADNSVQYEDKELKDAYSYGDFAAMTMLGIGWGLSAYAQLGHDPTTGDALLAASCYQGAYAATRNVDTTPAGALLTLSPADMDEASVALLTLVGADDAYGSRGTQGLDRIQSFITGYFGTIGAC
jgi:predicted metalloprotease